MASARKDAHSSADRSATSVADAASAVRPATSPFLYRIAAWETGAGGGKAASAAGADSSGPGVGADGSGTAAAVRRRGPGGRAKHGRCAFKVGVSKLDLKVRVGPRSLRWRRRGAAQARVLCRCASGGRVRWALIPKRRRRHDSWGRGPVTLAVSVGAASEREAGARSNVATSGRGGRPSGVQATRQAAPATAKSGPNRNMFMGPVPLRKDGPVLVNKM